MSGKVYIAGAGPGDAGLISVKALRVLQLADAVVYDYLVNPELLKNIKPGAQAIYVGKKAGNHTLSQDEINELLVELALQGKLVIRLKGGDPFVFGRGGEEALVLKEKNIDFEVIPGITSGIAAPAYAGIPVTHRNISSSVTFVSGHDANNSEELNLNWQAFASLKGTLVFYMGVNNLEKISKNLVQNGLDTSTPVAVIRYGTYSFQKQVVGTLENIDNKVKEAGLKPPALIVVGDVISIGEQIPWFTSKTLHGKTIMVTRSRDQISGLSELLRQKGATVIEFPTIEIVPLKDYSTQKEIISKLIDFQWLVFTSTNTIRFFFDILKEQSLDSRVFYHTKIACIGKETASYLQKFGLKADLVPEKYTAETLAANFESYNLKQQSILLPSSNLSRDILGNELEKQGANVVRMPLYENRIPSYTAEEIEKILERPVDCIAFSSSSTVTNFFEIVRNQFSTYFEKTIFASIGPITSETIRKKGFAVSVEPDESTITALTESIENYFIKSYDTARVS